MEVNMEHTSTREMGTTRPQLSCSLTRPGRRAGGIDHDAPVAPFEASAGRRRSGDAAMVRIMAPYLGAWPCRAKKLPISKFGPKQLFLGAIGWGTVTHAIASNFFVLTQIW